MNVLVPIFFTYTGLRTDIALLDSWPMWGWALLLLALATVGKFGGGYWAARWSGMDRTDARAIGIMMNTRGLMELIVINIGLLTSELSRRAVHDAGDDGHRQHGDHDSGAEVLAGGEADA